MIIKTVNMTRPKFSLIAVSAIVALGGNFSFGYNAIFNPALYVFQSFLNESYTMRYGSPLNESQFSIIWSAFVALPMFGAVFGPFSVPFFAEKFGRKWTVVFGNLPTIFSSTLMFLARRLLLLEVFLLGRLLWGLNMGIGTSIVGLFLTECSPLEFRGRIASLHGLTLYVMLTLGMLLGTPALLGRPEYLDFMLLLPIFVACLQMFLMTFVPDTPKHLLLTKSDEKAAQKSIAFYYGSHFNVGKVKAQFADEAELDRDREKLSAFKWFQDPKIRKGILIGMAANLAQVLTGTSIYYAYSTAMFARAGISAELAQYGSVLMAFLNALTTAIVSLICADRFSRHRMLLISLFLCLLCNLGYSIFAEVSVHVNGTWPEHVTAAFVLLFQLAFSCGAGQIPWYIASELVPQNIRSLSQSFAMVANFGVKLADMLVFYPLFNAIGTTYSFLLLHIAPSVVLIVILFRYMPKTTGFISERTFLQDTIVNNSGECATANA